MFELGTRRSRLWRSSRNEWFGGTAGFYWGCNNPKDLDVRLETIPSPAGRPANAVFHPSDRDRTWLELFDRKTRGIDVDFGFRAFTTPPLAASHSLDAKFTTTAMVKELATWAKFGPPLGPTWEPTESERLRFPGMHPLVANDWTVLRAEAPGGSPTEPVKKAVNLAKVEAARDVGREPEDGRERHTRLGGDRAAQVRRRPLAGRRVRRLRADRRRRGGRQGTLARRQSQHSRPRPLRPVAVCVNLALPGGRRPARGRTWPCARSAPTCARTSGTTSRPARACSCWPS